MSEKIGRLAMRREGKLWVAYYALNHTMDGAIFLGSIQIAAVEQNAERKAAFFHIMRDIVSDILFEKTGARPDWGVPIPAPEHERGGSA